MMFPASFVAKKMEMVICSGNAPFLHCCMFGNSLGFLLLWLLIRVIGHDVFFGMVGYLDAAVVVTGTLGCFFWTAGLLAAGGPFGCLSGRHLLLLDSARILGC